MSKSKIIKDSIIEIENIKEEAKLLAKEEILNEVQETIEQRTKQLFEEKLKSLEEGEELDEEFTSNEINIHEEKEDCGCDDNKDEEPLEEKINKDKEDLKNKMKKNKLNLKEEEMSLDEMFNDMNEENQEDDIDIEALHKSGDISDEAYNLWKQSYGEKNNTNMNNTQEINEIIMVMNNGDIDYDDFYKIFPNGVVKGDVDKRVEDLYKRGEISDKTYKYYKNMGNKTNTNMNNTQEIDETWDENSLMEFLNELDNEEEESTEEIPSDEIPSDETEMGDEENDTPEGDDFSEEDMEDEEEFDFDDIEFDDEDEMDDDFNFDSEGDEMEDMDNIEGDEMEDDDFNFDSEEEEDLEDMDSLEGDDFSEEDEDFEEMDLEEALAYPNQIHKNVGGKSFPQRDGAPERRSNMNEDIKRLQKLVETVVNENKTLKAKVQKTEALETLLKETKNKLYDTMVLAQKTVYANKVLVENTLTNEEKAEVMKSFSKANSKDELISLNESFNSKFNDTKRTLNTSISKVISTSKGILKEHTISDEENNTTRMKNLINYKPKK